MRPLAAFLFLCTLAAPVSAQIGNATWATPVPKNFAEPAWWDQGVVFVGNWEPLVFRLRHGGELTVNAVEDYRREHAEETVVKLKEAGVNMILTHFYKTGLDSDGEDIEETKRLAALCHKHGLKVGTYIGGTIFAELLLRDAPQAKGWICYDEHGDPVRYSTQTYRYRPDFNHPGYVEHMKRVIRVAVEDVKTDLIHLDNHALIAPPWTCNTPEVNRRFREFLAGKYSPEQLKNRFGFSDLRAVTVPTWHGIAEPDSLSPINDPLIQEWTDFRCQDFAAYYGKLAAYARQLNPEVIVELNPHGIYGSNRAFLNGVDHARLLPHGSVFWSEERNEAGITEDGILVSKIRSFKLARTLEQTMFVYTGPRSPSLDRRPWRLLMAEAMAFNRNCLGHVGTPLDAYSLPEEARRYIRFYRENNRHFASTRVVADVALLRSFPSMANNSLGPHLETTLMEQLLIQHKIPFDIIFDQQLADLSKYRALILADQESLSDRAVEQIREYVRNGGGLLATGSTSLYYDWRRRRTDFGLSDVLGVHWSTEAPLPPARRSGFSRGRASYLPAVVPSGEMPAPGEDLTVGGGGFTNKYWKLPANTEAIVAEIRHVAGTPLSAELKGAPLTTVIELTDKKDGSERVLHWINYKPGSRTRPSRASVAVPKGRKVSTIELLSPDRGAPAQLSYTVEGDRVRFELPSLEVYHVAVLHLSE